uniref:Uncharacterized protein n=1 Tax=Arundo donax TaxID=35708 RepID=A0A0A9HEN1_ARUDO
MPNVTKHNRRRQSKSCLSAENRKCYILETPNIDILYGQDNFYRLPHCSGSQH